MSTTLDRPSVTVAPAAEQVPLRIRAITPEGVLSTAGSAVAALALTWLLYERVLPFSGAGGFWLCAIGLFVAIYGVVCWGQWDDRLVVDRIARLLLIAGCLIVLFVVAHLIWFTTDRGITAIVHRNFWTQTMVATGPLEPLTSGGMIHAMVGSLEQLGLATVFSVPLGITAALFLVEIPGPLARVVRTITEAMTALPEIVAGLFVYAFVVLSLGVPRSGFAAALALTVMMIPVVTRTSEVILRLVPGTLREASYALGGSQAGTVFRVILPTARSGLATAVILAMARAVGETSPVLLTAGFTKDLNVNPFSNAQTSLPLYIFTYVRYPDAAMVSRAFGAGLALMIMVLVLFVLARIIGGKAPGELTARQRRRVDRARSAGDEPPDAVPVGPGFDDVPVIGSPA